jgi:hypothetical protein
MMSAGAESRTMPPPTRPPGLGHAHYLLETDYFFNDAEPRFAMDMALFERAVRITARCVAQWADRYLARPCVQRDLLRQGALPSSIEERELFVDELFAWLAVLPDPILGDVLNLYQRDKLLLDQSDGMAYGFLTLSPKQFAQLQACWAANGLPSDLYYPAAAQRMVIEPVEKWGGVVRIGQRYTPRRWARRDPGAIDAVPVPSEEERVASILAALSQFQNALWLRRTELMEPERTRDAFFTAELTAITAVDRELQRLSLQIKGIEPHRTGGRSE